MLYALAAIGIALPVPPLWGLVLAMRFLCGVAIGGFTVGCPLYLSELAPVEQRGRFVSLFQIQVGAGVVAGFTVGSWIAHVTAQGAGLEMVPGARGDSGAWPAFIAAVGSSGPARSRPGFICCRNAF
jgi:MFS family permease